MATKEEILGFQDVGFIDVPVPEWGGAVVRLRAMSGAERDEYELSSYEEGKAAKAEKRQPRNSRARMLVHCIVDAEGKRIFGQADIDALGAKSGAALDRLFEAARKLNGYTEADAEALAKN